MHILIFGDQHSESLGGAQTSIRLQKKFLEAAGHTVTICQPTLHRAHKRDPAYLDVPSFPVSWDREYSVTLPSKRVDARLDAWLRQAPSVDIVHIQADFAYALIGYRFAARHGLPVVHTIHTNIDASIRQTIGSFYGIATRGLFALQKHFLGGRTTTLSAPLWAYIDEFSRRAEVVIAPSEHFARRLHHYGVTGDIRAIRTGVDDAVAEAVFAQRDTSKHERPRLVWTGRMSPEKRLLPFLEAVKLSGIDADIEIYGTGVQLAQAKKYAAQHLRGGHVRFKGKVSYKTMLQAIARADILVQTSIGFETQGMTAFEAVTLDTHVVVSDSNVASELPADQITEARGKDVGALADALVEAVRSAAKKPRAAMRRDFLQSTIEKELIALYEGVRTRH